MSKYEIKFPGMDTEFLTLEKDSATLGEKEYEYEAKRISENILLIRVNGENHIIRLESSDGVNQELICEAVKYKISCKNELDIIKEKYIGTETSRFKEKIESPMPGGVVKINVNEGDLVKSGDVMLVLEAMKMENEIKAETDCIVKSLHVSEKVSVDKGQLLITLSEPE